MTDQPAELEQPRTTHLADVAGVVVDMRRVPDYGPPRPGEVVVRSTGEGYLDDDGNLVARTDLVVHGEQ